jgi:hypothetical protein
MEIEPSTTRPGATGDVPTYVPRIAALLIEIERCCVYTSRGGLSCTLAATQGQCQSSE